MDESNIGDQRWIVEIIIDIRNDESVNISTIKIEVSERTKMDIESIIVSIEYDFEGRPIRVNIYAEDERSANNIKTKLNESCEDGTEQSILCHNKGIHIREPTQLHSLSDAPNKHCERMCQMLITLSLFSLLHIMPFI